MPLLWMVSSFILWIFLMVMILVYSFSHSLILNFVMENKVNNSFFWCW